MTNSHPDMVEVQAAFNQLVVIYTVNILANAEQQQNLFNLTTMLDKDDVFDEEYAFHPFQPQPQIKPDSGDNSDSQQISNVSEGQSQINYSTQIQSLAVSMFDGLTKFAKDKPPQINSMTNNMQNSTTKTTNNERDLKLARDCRELLEIQGQDNGSQVIFARPDGKGNYKFALEKASDTFTLNARDRPVNPILVESQGEIIASTVTNTDVENISKAIEMLTAQQSQSALKSPNTEKQK